MTVDSAMLLSLVRRPGAQGRFLRSDETDWTALVQAALRHGVAGLLCSHLVAFPDESVPRDIAAAADVYLSRQKTQADTLIGQLLEVLDALDAAGIQALPFKGPLLSQLAFGNAALRSSRDLDFLIPVESRARALEVLRTLGYRSSMNLRPAPLEAYYRRNGQDILYAEGRVPLEPHWDFAPSTLSIALDVKGMWSRVRGVSFAGRSILSLSPEDTLFTTCLHGSKEKWWRLLNIADVAGLVEMGPDLNWDALAAETEKTGTRRMVLLGLVLARDLLGAKLPGEITDLIDRDEVCGPLAETVREQLFNDDKEPVNPFRISRFHWQMRERLADRLKYGFRTLVTPSPIHYRLVDLPDALSFGYVPLKLTHDYVALPAWNLWKRMSGASASKAG